MTAPVELVTRYTTAAVREEILVGSILVRVSG